MALCLPVLGLLLAGLMEFSHFFLVTNTLNAAARRGAHLGSYENITNAQVEAEVRRIVRGAVADTDATVIVRDASIYDTPNFNVSTVNYDSLPVANLANADEGDCFLVQVTLPYDNVALLPPFWIKGRTVTGRAVMRHE